MKISVVCIFPKQIFFSKKRKENYPVKRSLQPALCTLNLKQSLDRQKDALPLSIIIKDIQRIYPCLLYAGDSLQVVLFIKHIVETSEAAAFRNLRAN